MNTVDTPSLSITALPAKAFPTETMTVTPVPTKRATATPTKTIVLTPTPALITPPPTPPTQNSISTQSMLSPNGEWIAQTSFEQPGEQYHVQFKLFRIDGTKTWTIVDYWQSGLGYSYPQLHHWSRDSQYFYASGRWIADGPCEFFPINTAWQKINIRTGQVTEFTLPPGRGHALSPTGARLAYVGVGYPLYLIVRTLESGEEQKVLLPVGDREKAEAGNVFWSPNEKALTLTISDGNFCNSSRLDFALVRVDFPSLDTVELITNSRDLLVPLKWVEPNHILLSGWSGSWWIDATSGQPTTSPETSMP